ncbi:MAG TPA: hypothetical protein O0X97_03790 [Methanocorpusculum sp.]|nr:hypothetical protein [Methanocorpusculum sp.]
MKQKHTLKRKSDDAVSNVVVMMLILSVIVIAFSVFVGIYLPQMKETSEMMHSEDVKSAFLQVSSDMDSVYSRGQAGTYSQLFTLGGGEILLSSSKSAGTVEIHTIPLNETNPDTLKIYYTNKTLIYSNGTRGDTAVSVSELSETISLTAVNISYTPVLPFWEEQGYLYEKGVVWVRKGDIHTPASTALYSADDGYNQMNQTADSWILMMKPAYLTANKTFTVTKDSGGNVTGISENTQYIYTMTLVNVSADEKHRYLSGSADAGLKISANVLPEITEYELTDNPLELNGESLPLTKGSLPSLLRVTRIEAKVSVE